MERIHFEDIHKTYLLGRQRDLTALQYLLEFRTQSRQAQTLTVLDGVSGSVAAGEVVGVIGSNGSGKSTLLRIIANIIVPDRGRVHANGRMVPLINLDTGVKARLTMRDNIYLVCTLLGMSDRDIRQRFESIVAYAGLEQFVYSKWFQFSDGMKQKVMFSVGIHADPEILLLDEAISAGDEAFRNKSVKTIRELKARGTAILMVGHNLNTIEHCSDRILWLEKGVVRACGDPVSVVEQYRQI